MEFFFKGLLLGVSIAAPVGPMGVLCIRRTVEQGIRAGFFTGVGIALADFCYGSIVAFGLTAISEILLRWQAVLQSVGGLFLLYLGIRIFCESPSTYGEKQDNKTIRGNCVSAFLLTLSNPATILAFAGLLAAVGSFKESGGSWQVGLGIFAGSLLWWGFFSLVVQVLRDSLHWQVLRLVNYASGGIIAGFGAYVLAALYG